jgi:hypothetical protein
MKPLIYRLTLFALLLTYTATRANAPYFIAGKVTDEKGALVAGATVFISGSQKVTVTNNEGRFFFNNIDAGTYHLSVQMLGYKSYTQNVLVQTESADLSITLKVKPIMLKTVKIGSDASWAKNYQTFKKHFLGITPNGQHCTILNPEVISFGTQPNVLTAEADELLIIENKALGYRIRYLLKAFTCNQTRSSANYDGDPIFEPMEGTETEQAAWAANRLKTYKGSLMHFLRAVYHNTVSQEGFIANQLYSVPKNLGKSLLADPRPVKFDTIVSVIDTSFISAKFTSLYVDYDSTITKAAKVDSTKKKFSLNANGTIASPTGSIAKLYLKEAIIDSRGNYVDYRTFLLQGLWGRRGIADQLPFEYQPTIAAN